MAPLSSVSDVRVELTLRALAKALAAVSVKWFSDRRSAASEELKRSELAIATAPSSLMALSCKSTSVRLDEQRSIRPIVSAVPLPTSVRAAAHKGRVGAAASSDPAGVCTFNGVCEPGFKRVLEL
eukprot:7274480-Prymnesium_polylepis.1